MSTRISAVSSLLLLFAAALTLPVVAASPGHAHPAKGPRGGALVELGDEEFHAEVLLDERHSQLTVFLLDAQVKQPVATDSNDAFINVKRGNKPVQFRLTASPIPSDPAGHCSRFTLRSESLVADLHRRDSDARLRLTIVGKPYVVKLSLGHDHVHEARRVKR